MIGSEGFETKAVGRGAAGGYVAVRVVLGGLLMAAGMLKGHELVTVGPGPGHPWASAGLVAAEPVFGLWLLFGFRPVATRYAALVGFTAFAAVSAWKVASGAASCGCFGRVGVDPRYTLGLDLAAVGALLAFRPRRGARPKLAPAVVRARAVGFGLLASLTVVPWVVAVAGAQAARPGDPLRPATPGGLVVLRPETWVGSCCPLLGHLDVGGRLGRGRWTLVLFHHDCRRCRESVPVHQRRASGMAGRPGAPRTVFVEVPPYAPEGDRLVGPGPDWLVGRLSNAAEWLVATPTVIELDDCVVKSVATDD